MLFGGMPADLWSDAAVTSMASRERVRGLMAPYVGSQYSADEIWTYRRLVIDFRQAEEATLRQRAERIRAFDVPSLRGATFTLTRLVAVWTSLRSLLVERLPSVPWAAAEELFTKWRLMPIIRYALIYMEIEAPTDEATHEPMVLELVGNLLTVNHQPARYNWLNRVRPIATAPMEEAELGELDFRISRAMYANTRTPYIGLLTTREGFPAPADT
jgi:hypothetical protein